MKKSLLLVMAVMLYAITARAWTVQFTNPDNWKQVSVYAWDSNGNYTGGDWPGKPMTKEGDVWTYTGDGTPTYIIFNNGNSGNGNQTEDLDFVDGKTYTDHCKGYVEGGGEEGGGEEGGEDATDTTPIYISYDFSGGNWEFDVITMTYADGVYTTTINNPRGADGYITFGIGGKITNEKNWDGGIYRYGPSSDGTTISTGTSGNVLSNAETCYTVPSGKYDVTVKKVNNQWVAYFATDGGGGGGEEGDLCDNRRPGVTFTGSLPVLYITTDEVMIDRNLRDKDYRDGTYYLVDSSNPANNLGSEDSPFPLEIKARGNYTRTGFSKKPYKLKLGKKQAMMGLTTNKHFALLAHADEEHGFLNNTVGFWLGQQIGLPWTPRETPIEVVINGDYRGIYFLTESIRVDELRIDITELDDEVTDPTLCSGGYIVEMDNYPGEGQIILGEGDNVRRITPDTPEVLSDIQRKFLTEQFTTMDDMLFANNDEIWRYLDLDDAARYYIVMEILDHWEAYHGSTYLFRDFGTGQKWHFSPLWDCGHAFDRTDANSYFTELAEYGNDWIVEMRANDKFMAQVKETWQWFWSGNRYQELQQMIEEFTAKISQAAARDWERWNGVALPDQYEDPLNYNALTNPSPVLNNTDLASKRSHVKSALESKINFLVREWGNYENVNDEPARDTTEPAPLPSYVDPDFEPVYYTVYFQFEDESVNNMRIWIWNDDNSTFLADKWDNRPTLTAKTNSAGVKYFEFTFLGTDFDLTRNPQIKFGGGADGSKYETNEETFVAGALYYIPKEGAFTVTENWIPNPIPVSGTLPVLSISVTDGSEIDDTVTEHAATASFEGEGFKAITDVALEIRGRGTTTWADFDKKPYKLKFSAKQVLINGIEKSKHYVLLPWAADTELSYLRNIAGHAVSKHIGLDWTPGIEPVELVLNGAYRGVYFIVENIRPAGARVDIEDISDYDETTMPAVWSDYIVELDNTSATPDFSFGEEGCETEARFVLDSPEMSDLTRESDKEWIGERLADLHTAMTHLPNDLDNRYHEVIDRESFIRFYLVQEIMDDPESFTKSLYLHRSGTDGLWKFGPVWDFSGAFAHQGNKSHLNSDLTIQRDGHSHMMPLVSTFMQNLMVFNEVAIEFHKFTGTWTEKDGEGFPHWTWPYDTNASAPARAIAQDDPTVNKLDLVMAEIDEAAAKYGAALDYDKARWEGNPGSDTFDANVAKVKQYLSSNVAYLTSAFSTLTPSGIDGIQAGVSATTLPVEYFDITGRKVENPGSGIYIRRQGNNATKVFIP